MGEYSSSKYQRASSSAMMDTEGARNTDHPQHRPIIKNNPLIFKPGRNSDIKQKHRSSMPAKKTAFNFNPFKNQQQSIVNDYAFGQHNKQQQYYNTLQREGSGRNSPGKQISIGKSSTLKQKDMKINLNLNLNINYIVGGGSLN
jgi:hypothetical protein